MSRDPDFGVVVPERAGGLTLAELERRLQADGHSQEDIDFTLWWVSETRKVVKQFRPADMRGGH